MASSDPPSSGEYTGDARTSVPLNTGETQVGLPGVAEGLEVPQASRTGSVGGQQATPTQSGVHSGDTSDVGGPKSGHRVVHSTGTSQGVRTVRAGSTRVGANLGLEPSPTRLSEDGGPPLVGDGLAPMPPVETPEDRGYLSGGLSEEVRDSTGVDNPLLAETVRREATNVLRQNLPDLVVKMTNTILNQIVASLPDGLNVQTGLGLPSPQTQGESLPAPFSGRPVPGATPVTPIEGATPFSVGRTPFTRSSSWKRWWLHQARRGRRQELRVNSPHCLGGFSLNVRCRPRSR